jgi:hypothetical protein
MAMSESAAVQITRRRLLSFLEEIRTEDRAPEPQVNAGRRVCVVCGAFLSRYNPSNTYCAVHEPPNFRISNRR